jgi:hypothetical protein
VYLRIDQGQLTKQERHYFREYELEKGKGGKQLALKLFTCGF